MTNPYPWIVAAPLLCVCVNVGAHVLLSRVLRTGKTWGNMALAFVVGLLALAAFFMAVQPHEGGLQEFGAHLFLDLIVYVGFSYGYFHFVNINVASLRLRMLRELDKAAGGHTQEELIVLYGSRKIVGNRLDRLIQTGNLVERDGRLFLGPNRSFLILFWIFEVLKLGLRGRGNKLLAKG